MLVPQIKEKDGCITIKIHVHGTTGCMTIKLWEGSDTGEISFTQSGISYIDEEVDLTEIKVALMRQLFCEE
jgi:hypothetical protein